MLLMVFLFIVEIELLSCQQYEEDFLDQINRERKNLGMEDLRIHSILQLAAKKRCTNQEDLIETYQRMISKSYHDDQWAREEQLNQIFPIVGERIYLNGENIRTDLFDNSLLIPNLYRANFIYLGLAEYEYKNFSARCILYGSSSNFISNHRRLLRLLYILIGCGILLLSLIICSIINDRQRAKLKEDITENGHMILPQKSLTDRRTLGRLGSMIDERSSAVHSFFQTPK